MWKTMFQFCHWTKEREREYTVTIGANGLHYIIQSLTVKVHQIIQLQIPVENYI